jgi:integrase
VPRGLPPRLRRKHGAYYHVSTARHPDGSPIYYPSGQAKQVWRRLSADRSEALRLWAQIEGERDQAPILTVKDAVADYLLHALPDLAPRTQRAYQIAANRILPVFGHCRLDEVRTGDIGLYISRRGGVVANREIAFLSSVYRRQIAQGNADDNPCRGAPRNRERHGRNRPLPNREEIRAVLAHLPIMLHMAMEARLILPLRLDDMLMLTRQECRGGEIRLRIRKTGVARRFRITPTLTQILDLAAEVRAQMRVSSLYVFPARGGQPYSEGGVQTLWRRAREAAGVDARPNDIRARVITDAARMHGRDYAQALAAHLDGATTETYIRAREAELIETLDLAGRDNPAG